MLSDMESTSQHPTPEEASGALADAEASRSALANSITTPSWLFTSLGVAIAVQIATTAFGLARSAPWPLVAGVLVFVAVAGVQLLRFRQLSGVWLGGFVSRVVLGTGILASASYVVALGAAIWAAYGGLWWLVAVCSILGGAAYTLSGRRWMRAYRAQPAVHGRGEPALWLALLTIAAIAGLVLLLLLER